MKKSILTKAVVLLIGGMLWMWVMSVRSEPLTNIQGGMSSTPFEYIQASKLTVGDAVAGFGEYLALDGDTLAVGVPADGIDGSGSVYLFEPDVDNPGQWEQIAKLTGLDTEAGDAFGGSLALSGDTLIVGATNDDDQGRDAGAVYLFERNQGGPNAWGQVIKIVEPEGGMYNAFGRAVAIQGDTALVGSPVKSPGGWVYVFERNQGGPENWGLLTNLVRGDMGYATAFGTSLALDGDNALVGTYAGGNYIGSAYLFNRNQGGLNAWGQVDKLLAEDGTAYDYFGYHVGLDNLTAVIGATGDEGLSGSAYIFQPAVGSAVKNTASVKNTAAVKNTANEVWLQVAKLRADDWAYQDFFGMVVAISGDTAAIGAPGRQDSTGAVYLFARDQGGSEMWGQVVTLMADDPEVGASFGGSLEFDSQRLFIGAPGGSPNGAVYVFMPPNTPPTGLDFVLIPNPVGEGQEMTAMGHFTDPDSSDIFTVTVSWGDGSFEPMMVSGAPPTYTFALTHTYMDGPMAYPVDVVVEDRLGASQQISHTAMIDNLPPTLSNLPDQVTRVGMAITLTATLSDPGLLDAHTVVIQWTDAFSQALTLSAGASSFESQYTYALPGEYEVSVTVTDEDGGVAQSVFTVRVLALERRTFLPLIKR